MELTDRTLSVVLRRHGDECESPGFPGELILHEDNFGDGAGLREEILQIYLQRSEGNIADVEFSGHDYLLVCLDGLSALRISNCHWRSGELKSSLPN